VLKTLQERLQSDHELELSLSWRLATSELAAMTLSVPQITAQLEAVLAREPGALAIAIRSATANRIGLTAVMQRGRRFSLRWCDSMLAMREALCDVEQVDTIQ
jgi:hypothetical protein